MEVYHSQDTEINLNEELIQELFNLCYNFMENTNNKEPYPELYSSIIENENFMNRVKESIKNDIEPNQLTFAAHWLIDCYILDFLDAYRESEQA